MPRPYLVVRASIEESVLPEFERWYASEHLPNVMLIPGITKAYRTHCRRKGINWTTMYELSDDSAVQKAMASPEAERARGDWERWLPHVTDLSVEVYTGLGPLASLHHWN